MAWFAPRTIEAMPLFKKNETPAPQPEAAAPARSPRNGQSKGHATPSRKQAQQRNVRPLVANDRKEQRAQERNERIRRNDLARRAMETGDESHMPPQHVGVQRRFVREFVDARWSVGEFMMPAAFLLLLVSFVVNSTQNLALQNAMNYVLFALIIIVVIDSVLLVRALRKALEAKFGDRDRGMSMYGVTRGLQLHRFRLPKPLNKRGEWPS